MATNNVNNKVTFWNNVSFTPENVKNNFILNDIAGLDNKGIYFNSNKNYPHIIYNGYIYTTGSYISAYTPNNNVDPKGQVNVITNITADPFTKSISYQYTTIDIAYILKKIDELEKQASITDISDTITLDPDINDISLDVGEHTNNITYTTQSTRLSKVESDNTSIASVSKNDVDHTITIKAANELSEGNDNTQTAYIVLTSYSGIIGDKRYTSTEKKIKVHVNKKTQTISNNEDEFNVNLTIGGESKTLIIDGTYTDLVANTASQNINVSVSGTPIKNTITISPNSIGNASISVYAKSSTIYKKSETKEINVTVSGQPVETNYYWYVGNENPMDNGMATNINQSEFTFTLNTSNNLLRTATSYTDLIGEEFTFPNHFVIPTDWLDKIKIINKTANTSWAWEATITDSINKYTWYWNGSTATGVYKIVTK